MKIKLLFFCSLLSARLVYANDCINYSGLCGIEDERVEVTGTQETEAPLDIILIVDDSDSMVMEETETQRQEREKERMTAFMDRVRESGLLKDNISVFTTDLKTGSNCVILCPGEEETADANSETGTEPLNPDCISSTLLNDNIVVSKTGPGTGSNCVILCPGEEETADAGSETGTEPLNSDCISSDFVNGAKSGMYFMNPQVLKSLGLLLGL